VKGVAGVSHTIIAKWTNIRRNSFADIHSGP
jgi:hypothetical protein